MLVFLLSLPWLFPYFFVLSTLYLPLQLLWCHSEGYQWRVKTSEDRLLTGCLMFSKLKFISSYNQSVSLQYTQLMTPAIRNSLESHIYFWFKILAYLQTLLKKKQFFHPISRHQKFVTGVLRLQKRPASEWFFSHHVCCQKFDKAFYPVFEIKWLLKKFKTVAFKFFGNLFLILNPPCFVLSLFSRSLFWMYLYPLYHIYSPAANALYCYVCRVQRKSFLQLAIFGQAEASIY